MRIEIRDRFKPYTDQRGAEALLPQSSYGLTVYPCKVLIHDLAKNTQAVAEIDIALPGHCTEFTVQLDLERGEIAVFGTAESKYFRYFISYSDGKVLFSKNKGDLNLAIAKDDHKIVSIGTERAPAASHTLERLSFGSFKKQHLDTILKRGDLRDILPLWYALSQTIPAHQASKPSHSLLDTLKHTLSEMNKEKAATALQNLISAGFRSLLYPQKQDSLHQGYSLPVLHAESPLALVHEGGEIIRSLIIDTKGQQIAILPLLLPPLSSGRMTGIVLPNGASCSLEWRSGKLTRMLIAAQNPSQIDLSLPKNIVSFRIRDLKSGVTRKLLRDQKIDLAENTALFLDHFQH